MKELVSQARPAILLLAALTIITGALYPAAVTGLAQAIFPGQADGSLLMEKGRVVGSELIGQPFSDPGYFWGRLSATSPQPYNAAASGGSNLAATSHDLVKAARERIAALREADPGQQGPIPVDLVTSSASGLDPHISPAAALYQAHRVAQTRGLDLALVRGLVGRHTEGRGWGFLGEPRVNVLKLNLALQAATAKTSQAPEKGR